MYLITAFLYTRKIIIFLCQMMASKYMYDEGVDEEVFNDEWADSIEQEVDDVNQMETEFLDAMVCFVFSVLKTISVGN